MIKQDYTNKYSSYACSFYIYKQDETPYHHCQQVTFICKDVNLSHIAPQWVKIKMEVNQFCSY